MLGLVADTIRELVAAQVPEADALPSATWPWPDDVLATAVSRGYEHLSR